MAPHKALTNAKMTQGSNPDHHQPDGKRTRRWLESVVSGALSFRRMVRKEDLPKIFFVYLCLCHLAPAHPCGSNPLRRFRPLSRMLGKDINSLLNLLRDSNPPLYRQVQDEWRLYADCVGLVDTGYFKRSGGPGAAGRRGRGAGSEVDRRAGRLLELLHDIVSAGVAQAKRDLNMYSSTYTNNVH